MNVYGERRACARGTVAVGGARGYGSQALRAHSQEETGFVLIHHPVSSFTEGPLYLLHTLLVTTNGDTGPERCHGQLAQGVEQARVPQSSPQLYAPSTPDSAASADT